jgi:signal transduction histidine kinase
MVEAHPAALAAERLGIARHALPRPEALRWFAGVYFLILGTSILIMPQGSFSPWLGAFWLRAAAVFASGLLLLWLIVLAPPPPVSRALHFLAALPHLVMGVEYALLGAYTPAATLLILGAAVAAAPLLPRGGEPGARRPEILGLALGAKLVFQGVDLIGGLSVGVVVPAGVLAAPALLGALYLAGGLAVLVAQLAPGLPRWAVWGAHLFAGGLLLAFWAAQSWFRDPVFWALGAPVVVRGLALAALPWWGARVAALNGRALRVRLALALITAVLVPLAVVLPVVLEAVERRRVELSLERQRRSAITGAAFLAELARDHRDLLDRLAVSPGLRGEALAGVLARDGRLAELALYDRDGALLAAAAGLAPPALAAPGLASPPGETVVAAALPLPGLPGPAVAQARALRGAEGAPLGVLVAVMAPDAVAEALRRGAEEDSVAALVAPGGEDLVVAGPPQLLALSDLDAVLAAGAALAEQGPAASTVENREGPRLVGAAALPGLPWRVVMAVPQTTTLGDLTPLRQLAFAVTLLTALACGVAGWWMAGQLVGPIRGLVGAVGRIAQGEYRAPLPGSGPSELTQLSGAVGTMAAALDARRAEREGLVARLQAQNQELRDHEEAREESIRALSHDLRNPLTVISANAQRLARLLDGQALAREARIARSMEASAQRMNGMLQALADAMRVDAGTVPLRREAVRLPEALAALSAQLDSAEEERIQIQAAAELPPVAADPELLDRVLVNLLSNALKYSPPDEAVTVRVQRGEGELLVSVADRGIGMTPAEQEQLFRRYYRAEGARARSSGLGLGLYVTRALVEAHGGRIWVESAPGAGSTFCFTLPLATVGLERTV